MPRHHEKWSLACSTKALCSKCWRPHLSLYLFVHNSQRAAGMMLWAGHTHWLAQGWSLCMALGHSSTFSQIAWHHLGEAQIPVFPPQCNVHSYWGRHPDEDRNEAGALFLRFHCKKNRQTKNLSKRFSQLFETKSLRPKSFTPKAADHPCQSATSSILKETASTFTGKPFFRSMSAASSGRKEESINATTSAGVLNSCLLKTAACCEKAWSMSSWPLLQRLFENKRMGPKSNALLDCKNSKKKLRNWKASDCGLSLKNSLLCSETLPSSRKESSKPWKNGSCPHGPCYPAGLWVQQAASRARATSDQVHGWWIQPGNLNSFSSQHRPL